jgi:hypothetical protein
MGHAYPILPCRVVPAPLREPLVVGESRKDAEMSASQIICPQCSKDDMIQKVSAIYSAGTASGSFSGPTGGIAAPIGSGKPSIVGGYTTLRGRTQTALSTKLSPPAKPKPPSSAGGWLFVIVLVLISFALIGTGGTTAFFGVLFLIGAIGVGVLGSKGEASKRQRYETLTVRWTNALAAWNRLYYCSRNDCVFDPETGRQVPADRIAELLYT